MLGLGPISSRAISGGPFSLTAVLMAATAAGTITFSGTADTKVYQNLSATNGTITFIGAATWYCYFNQTATGTIRFAGDALLQLLGRPLVFYAMPERLTFQGIGDRLTFTAKADNYTFRGMR